MSPSLLNPKFGKAAWLVAVMVIAAASLSNPARTQQSAAKVSKPEVVGLLKSGMTSGQLRDLVRRYGVSFEMTADNEKELREAGANDELIKFLQEIAPGPASATTAAPKAPAAKSPPAAPAPAAPAGGPPVLVIEAKPGGAQVYVDDEPVGKTSSEGKLRLSTLSPKKHQLRLSLEGYKDLEQGIELAGGETVRLVLSFEPEPAMRAKMLLAKAIEAMGGAALRDLRAIEGDASMTLQMPQGPMSMVRHSLVVQPNPATGESTRGRFDFRTKQGTLVYAFDGRGGWWQTGKDTRDMTADQLTDFRTAVSHWPSILLQRFERGELEVQFFEQRQWQGKLVNVLRLADKAGNSTRVILEAETSAMLGQIYPGKSASGAAVEVEEIYQDFREVSGLRVPFKVTILHSGKPFGEAVVQSWVPNPPVDSTLFVKPR